MSQEKKPANYYGGYSLYRGGASAQAPAGVPPQSQGNLQGARKAAAAFGGDWFANPMMAGMMPPVVPFGAPADGAANKGAASSSASVQRPVMPFFGNFFAPMPGGSVPSMYKGTPVQRAAHNQHIHMAAQQQHFHHAPKPVHAPLKRNPIVAAPSFNEWTAFDAVVPAAHIHRHLDPIGTPAPHSVWDGTPAAADATAALHSMSMAPLAPMPSPSTQQVFSVWSSPVAVTRSGATTPTDETPETVSSSVVASSLALDAACGEEEEWMEHLKSTLHAVLLDEEQATAAGKRAASPLKMKMEKEWAQRLLQGF
jgi:hypothetical protein